MSAVSILDLTRDGLVVVLWVSLPIVLISTVAALLVAILQAVTQIQDQSIGQSVRLVSVMLIIIIGAGWMGGEVLRFAHSAFQTLTVLP
jgi:type III secretion protein S